MFHSTSVSPLSGQPTNVDNSDGHEHHVGTGSTMDRKRVMDREGNRWEGVVEVPLLCNLSFYLRRHSYKKLAQSGSKTLT